MTYCEIKTNLHINGEALRCIKVEGEKKTLGSPNEGRLFFNVRRMPSTLGTIMKKKNFKTAAISFDITFLWCRLSTADAATIILRVISESLLGKHAPL
jgi:hypothetical protein